MNHSAPNAERGTRNAKRETFLMPNVKITLQYDGTDYNGWQIQSNGRTIQGELTRALSILDQRHVTVYGAGRTDAGVHAEGQVANFILERDFDLRELRDGLNGNLDRDLRVVQAEIVADSFHARASARLKTYRYRIWTADVVSPFVRRYVHHYRGQLDVEEMRRAADLLIGEHDFRAFTVTASDVEGSVRTIERLDIVEEENVLGIHVAANGFLRYMVRAIAGTLIDVGRGHLSVANVSQALSTLDRDQAGPTAPACGLTLLRVDY
ncbi:MAG TPA: tRNA pseudouridine(38-40) synthase TruA [Blastocatellia bacterium]|nr:tRNA pseudouridine(38-40) synthase TruA [Blastocatellia bacterium]